MQTELKKDHTEGCGIKHLSGLHIQSQATVTEREKHPFIWIAREHGIRFFETSAKANISIEKAFLTLAEDILRKTPVKEPNSENVDISGGSGVTGWKSKCCS